MSVISILWVIYSFATKSRRVLSFATSSNGCSVLPLHRAQVLWRGQTAKFGPIPSNDVSERVGPDLTCGTGQHRTYRWDRVSLPDRHAHRPRLAHRLSTALLPRHAPAARSPLPCSRDHLPRRPLLGRPLLGRHLLRRYCDATVGAVVPPVRPPRGRRNGERQR
jgi:hypothetical protein